MKEQLRGLAFHALRSSGFLSVRRSLRVRSGRGWASALVFHRLSEQLPEDGLTITPRRFDSILRMLKRDYEVLSVDEMATRIEGGGPFLGREVVITFDDGYVDNFVHAAPLLQAHGLPACFFITAGYVGTKRDFPWDEARGLTSGLMTWDHARQLVEQGFTIGCHTWSHPDLGTEPTSSADRELSEARSRIEDATGAEVNHFAYPFGGRNNITSDWINTIRESGFRTNWSADNGYITTSTHAFYIPRIGAAPQRSLAALRIDIEDAW